MSTVIFAKDETLITNVDPNWGQSTDTTYVPDDRSNDYISMRGLNHQGADISGTDVTNGGANDTLTLVYRSDTDFNFFLIGGVENYYSVPGSESLAIVNIPLSNYPDVNLTNVVQYKVDGGNGGNLDLLYIGTQSGNQTLEGLATKLSNAATTIVPPAPTSIDLVYDNAFNGATYDPVTNVYTFPTGAADYAGFGASLPTEVGSVSFPSGAQITFDASLNGSTTLKFKFEDEPYPKNYITFDVSVNVSGSTSSYSVTVPSQGAQTYKSVLMYIVERDVSVTVTNVKLLDAQLNDPVTYNDPNGDSAPAGWTSPEGNLVGDADMWVSDQTVADQPSYTKSISYPLGLETGASYQLKFYAKGREGRKLIAGIGQNFGPNWLNDQNEFVLTTDWAPYEFEIHNVAYQATEGRVFFDAGHDLGPVYVDHVSLVKTSGDAPPAIARTITLTLSGGVTGQNVRVQSGAFSWGFVPAQDNGDGTYSLTFGEEVADVVEYKWEVNTELEELGVNGGVYNLLSQVEKDRLNFPSGEAQYVNRTIAVDVSGQTDTFYTAYTPLSPAVDLDVPYQLVEPTSNVGGTFNDNLDGSFTLNRLTDASANGVQANYVINKYFASEYNFGQTYEMKFTINTLTFDAADTSGAFFVNIDYFNGGSHAGKRRLYRIPYRDASINDTDVVLRMYLETEYDEAQIAMGFEGGVNGSSVTTLVNIALPTIAPIPDVAFNTVKTELDSWNSIGFSVDGGDLIDGNPIQFPYSDLSYNNRILDALHKLHDLGYDCIRTWRVPHQNLFNQISAFNGANGASIKMQMGIWLEPGQTTQEYRDAIDAGIGRAYNNTDIVKAISIGNEKIFKNNYSDNANEFVNHISYTKAAIEYARNQVGQYVGGKSNVPNVPVTYNYLTQMVEDGDQGPLMNQMFAQLDYVSMNIHPWFAGEVDNIATFNTSFNSSLQNLKDLNVMQLPVVVGEFGWRGDEANNGTIIKGSNVLLKEVYEAYQETSKKDELRTTYGVRASIFFNLSDEGWKNQNGLDDDNWGLFLQGNQEGLGESRLEAKIDLNVFNDDNVDLAVKNSIVRNIKKQLRDVIKVRTATIVAGDVLDDTLVSEDMKSVLRARVGKTVGEVKVYRRNASAAIELNPAEVQYVPLEADESQQYSYGVDTLTVARNSENTGNTYQLNSDAVSALVLDGNTHTVTLGGQEFNFVPGGNASGGGTSGGNSSGDPHIMTMEGNVYELPDVKASYRMVEGEDLMVNASTRFFTEAEKDAIRTYYLNKTGDAVNVNNLVTDGVVQNEVFIKNEDQVISYNFDTQTLRSNGAVSHSLNGDVLSLTLNNSAHGLVSVRLGHYANPQVFSSVSVTAENKTGMHGLLVREYAPESYKISSVLSVEKKEEGQRVTNSARTTLKKC